MTRLAVLVLALAACSACGDDGNATVDAPPDQCAPEIQFTGELVDWDSTTSAFMGVPGAKFTLASDPTKTSMTAPNGRFVLCIPYADGIVNIEPMAGSDYVAGKVVVNKDIVAFDTMLSYRGLKLARAAAFGFDASKAHVFVNVQGGSRGVSSSPAPTATHTFDGTTWSQGAMGTNLYLANLSGAATATLSASGGSVNGAGAVPITPGQFTYVTLVAK